jgi:hypothetical protein
VLRGRSLLLLLLASAAPADVLKDLADYLRALEAWFLSSRVRTCAQQPAIGGGA